ncbi:RNA polymerase sigma factor [Thermopirellula anaerolimosa]
MATVLQEFELEEFGLDFGLPVNFQAEEKTTETCETVCEEPQDPVSKLLTAAARGDRFAANRIVGMFERYVRDAVRRRLRDESDVEETTQDVFIQAFRKLDQLHDKRCFAGWLRRIADRLAINQLVRRRRERTVNFENLDQADSGGEPWSEVVRREQRKAVWEGLQRLGEMDRDTLVAFYIEGNSLVEMSRRFDSPVGTIKRRLHTARKRLAKELTELHAA